MAVVVVPWGMKNVWLLHASNYEEHRVVGVFATKAEAEAEKVRVEAAYAAHEPNNTDSHYVTKETLGMSSLTFLVRVAADGTPTDTMVSTVSLGYPIGPRSYDEIHDDGSAYDAFGLTYEDALRMAQEAAVAGVPIPDNT